MHTHAKKHARWARLALATVTPMIGAAAIAAPAVAQTPDASSHYHFRTIDNSNDRTFNQLLGINRNGLIAGYFGSGLQGHPNQGYLLFADHGQQTYKSENWPESTQTQVTGLNDHGITVGFWSSMNNPGQAPVNDNRAFVSYKGYFLDGDFPTDNPATPPMDQLLGVNDNDVAVGFYTDGSGNTHAYTFNIRRNRFAELTPAEIMNPSAAGINNRGDIAGFGTDSSGDASNGRVVGYLLQRNGRVTILNVPGSSMTQALGVNDNDEVVGVYQVGSGASATSYGFTWTPQREFQTVNDPQGVGATTINGVNDRGDLVGFYADSAGNTDGLVATPHNHG